jgi:hypothetical protein
VAHSELAGERSLFEGGPEVDELALRPHYLQHFTAVHGDARRIVTPVLEPGQALQDDIDTWPGTDVTNDTAHNAINSSWKQLVAEYRKFVSRQDPTPTPPHCWKGEELWILSDCDIVQGEGKR